MRVSRSLGRASWTRVVLSVLVLSSLVACRTATLEMRDGTAHEGKITASTPSTITVTDDDGEEHEVARADVVGIDHPGVAEMITGGSLTAVGLAMAIPGALIFSDTQDVAEDRQCTDFACVDPETDDETLGLTLTVAGSVLAIAGAVTLVSGGVIYARSKSAAEPAAMALDEVRVAPSALSDGRRMYGGATLQLSW